MKALASISGLFRGKRLPGLLLAALLAAGVSTGLLYAGTRAAPAPPPVAGSTTGGPQWVRAIRTAKDVTGKGSWFKRVVKAIVGLDDRKKALLQPEGVAVDSGGRIFVADPRAGIVRMFDPERKKYKELRAHRSDPMVAPVDVALDGAGRVYVSDAARARLFVFSSKGKFLHTLGGLGREESIFLRCTGIAIDAKRGRLFVVDTDAMRVVELTLDGRVLRKIGKRGTGPGEFNYPTFIAVAPDGSFWVSDSLNFRVEHFDAEGRFLSAFGHVGALPGQFYRPKGIAVDGSGDVYVVEGMYDRVQVFDPSGRLLLIFGGTGSGPGRLDLPTGIALGENGQVVVSDALNRRVGIFRVRADALRLPAATSRPGGGN